MSFRLHTTGNFACFALRARVSPTLRSTFHISNGVYASSETPFIIDDFWKGELGKLETRHINECNLFILATSDDPAISERDLLSNVHTYYYSLLLQGVGYNRRGVSLAGPNSLDGMRVTALGRLPDYYEPPKVLSSDVGSQALLDTVEIARGIDTIYANQQGSDYLRLRKGFYALLEGIQQSQVHERLHQFVRAIEAVIRPRQGEGTGKFKYRCQFFAGRKPSDQKILGELYEMRSAAEHLNPLREKLSDYPSHEHENLITLRAYQSELMASFVYRKILSDRVILPAFHSEQSITDLWSKDARALINYWGNTLDLDAATKDGYLDYL